MERVTLECSGPALRFVVYYFHTGGALMSRREPPDVLIDANKLAGRSPLFGLVGAEEVVGLALDLVERLVVDVGAEQVVGLVGAEEVVGLALDLARRLVVDVGAE